MSGSVDDEVGFYVCSFGMGFNQEFFRVDV